MTRFALDDWGSASEIFSADIIARIDELESEVENLDEGDADRIEAQAELKALREIEAEADLCMVPDWDDGWLLILDSHFTKYAEELANAIGAVNSDIPWPKDHIDWEAAADALKAGYFGHGYIAVCVHGELYWRRI